jgi:ABC-type sugar transport system ATPase subunit
MTLLGCENIRKSFFGVPVLKEVSFQVGSGSVLGLVGENGAGKSTLMNVLGGIVPPDSGRMQFDGQPYSPGTPRAAMLAGMAFIHQELNLFSNLNIAENLFLAGFPVRKLAGIPWIQRSVMRRETARLLAVLDLDLDPGRLVSSLAPGERQLVEIAKALSLQAKLIILDEPTTSLTERESQKLFLLLKKLKSQGVALIYISHNLGDVMRLCDELLILRDGAVVGSGAREEFSLEKLVTLMVGRSLSRFFPPKTNAPSDETVLEVNGLSQPGIVKDIDFKLHRGEVVGVAGLMGSGRTELARILFGLDPFERGEIRMRGKTRRKRSPLESLKCGMAFLTENRREQGLLMESSVNENLGLVALRRFARPYNRLMDQAKLSLQLEETAREVCLECAAPDQLPVKALSGGNQQKVALGKWLLQQPSVLILDEPTRGIDVGAKYEIYQLIDRLAAAGVAVLVISSEIEELMGICDRLLIMRQGKLAGSLAHPAFDREAILRMALGG